MRRMRITVGGLIVFLVLTPLLGFAAGDFALQTWTKHPRHAKAEHPEAPRPALKSPPATVAFSFGPPVLALLGPVALADAVLSLPLVSRPPFVPPRS